MGDPGGPFARYFEEAAELEAKANDTSQVLSSFSSKLATLDGQLKGELSEPMKHSMAQLDSVAEYAINLAKIEGDLRSGQMSEAERETIDDSRIKILEMAATSIASVVGSLDKILEVSGKTTHEIGNLEVDIVASEGKAQALRGKSDELHSLVDHLVNSVQAELEGYTVEIKLAEQRKARAEATISQIKDSPAFDFVDFFHSIKVTEIVRVVDNDAVDNLEKVYELIKSSENEILEARAKRMAAESLIPAAQAQLATTSGLPARFSRLTESFAAQALQLNNLRAKVDLVRVSALNVRRALGKADNNAAVMKVQGAAKEIAKSVLTIREVVGSQEQLSVDWKDRKAELESGLEVIVAKVIENERDVGDIL